MNGETVTFVIDADAAETNGNEAKIFQATWSGGGTFHYSFDISSVTPGTYYLYSLILPTGYMVYGWYGATTVNDFHQPRNPAAVQCGSQYDFSVEMT